MFGTCIRRRLATKLRIYFLFVCLLLLNCVTAVVKLKNPAENHDHFNNGQQGLLDKPEWKLAPLGMAAREILRLFIRNSASGGIKSTLLAGIKDYDKFMYSVIGYTFIQQIGMTVIVAIGLLGVFLLLLLPYFIWLYRSRQMAAIRESEPEAFAAKKSRRKGWRIFEFLCVFLAISVFGALLMCFSVINFDSNLRDMFNFTISAVNKSYEMKENIDKRYKYNLVDVSRSTLDTVPVWYDVYFNASKEFMTELATRIRSAFYMSNSILSQIDTLRKALISDKKTIEALLNSTDEIAQTLTLEYRTTLDSLKTVFDKENASRIFGSVVDPLLVIPNYSLPDTTPGIYYESIQRLEEIPKLNLSVRIENMEFSLRFALNEPNYGLSVIVAKLNDIASDTQLEIHEFVRNYVSFINFHFKEEDRAFAVNEIRKVQRETLTSFDYLLVLLLVFSIFGASLGIFFFLMYCLGIFGTKRFQIQPSGVSLHKSGLSHCSAKIMIVSAYFTAVFLALFWLLSIFIFSISAVPFELCSSSEDKSLFNATIDHPAIQNKKYWYSMFSSEKFESTLVQLIENCEKDKSYFGPMHGFEVNASRYDHIKAEFDPNTDSDVVLNTIQNFAYVNISRSDIATLNLENLLNFDIHSYFRGLTEFLRAVDNTNGSKVLNRIRDHPQSSENLKNAAQAALSSYELLTGELSTIAAGEIAFTTSLDAAKINTELIDVEINSLIIQLETLDIFIQSNATDIYLTVLNSTVNEMIDAAHYNLSSSVMEFRRSVSFCPSLLQYYNYFLFIFCEHILYPVSLCWLGSFFVDIFLLLSVFLCLYSVPLFLITQKSSLPDIPRTVHAEDLPSTSEAKESIAHVLKSETATSASDGAATSSSGKLAITSESSLPVSSVNTIAAEPDDQSQIEIEESVSTASSDSNVKNSEISAKGGANNIDESANDDDESLREFKEVLTDANDEDKSLKEFKEVSTDANDDDESLREDAHDDDESLREDAIDDNESLKAFKEVLTDANDGDESEFVSESPENTDANEKVTIEEDKSLSNILIEKKEDKSS